MRIMKYNLELDLSNSCVLCFGFTQFNDLAEAAPVFADTLDSWFKVHNCSRLDFATREDEEFRAYDYHVDSAVAAVVAMNKIIKEHEPPHDPKYVSAAEGPDISFRLSGIKK